jgi:hypothetical protein
MGESRLIPLDNEQLYRKKLILFTTLSPQDHQEPQIGPPHFTCEKVGHTKFDSTSRKHGIKEP